MHVSPQTLVRISEVDNDTLYDDMDAEDEYLETNPEFIKWLEARRQAYRTSDGGRTLEAYREQLLNELIDELASPDPHIRDAALQALTEMGPPALEALAAYVLQQSNVIGNE
ncbi:MAG: hypothetical protein HC914_05970 [Chloroflexaceae bacterium]|nr:hypothetical protein [Chloroflexaceae bacterium]